MQQLIKRLEIIKAAISLEDEERIALHLGKIRSMEMEAQAEGLDDILASLDALDYPQALSHIAGFIDRHSDITANTDPEIVALRMELQGLERKLTELSGERDEYLHTINDFNHQYALRLGGTISEILKLQVMIAGAEEAAHANDDEETRRRLEEKREEVQGWYQQFHDDYEAEQEKPEPEKLNGDELQRLKKACRKANRLCYPDMVADELKEQASAQFQALDDAYAMNDLARVEEVLASLESGGGFLAASEQVADKEKLRTHIGELRQRIDALAAEIAWMQSNENWQLIVQLGGDYEAYFSDRGCELNQEMTRLQHQFREIV